VRTSESKIPQFQDLVAQQFIIQAFYYGPKFILFFLQKSNLHFCLNCHPEWNRKGISKKNGKGIPVLMFNDRKFTFPYIPGKFSPGIPGNGNFLNVCKIIKNKIVVNIVTWIDYPFLFPIQYYESWVNCLPPNLTPPYSYLFYPIPTYRVHHGLCSACLMNASLCCSSFYALFHPSSHLKKTPTFPIHLTISFPFNEIS
jgi:hypothetical protein